MLFDLTTDSLTEKEKALSDGFYDVLIETNQNILFEFYRNVEIVEKITQTNINLQKPFFDFVPKSNISIEEPYIIINPGTSEKFRQWSSRNYGKLICYIKNNYKVNIVITGSSKDSSLAKEISNLSYGCDIIDLTGKTTLTDLISLVSKSKLLITGDTGSMHIGGILNANTLCLSNGHTIIRFVPYPVEISKFSLTIFPQKISMYLEESNLELLRLLSNGYGYEEDINLITVESVIEQMSLMNINFLKETSNEKN